MSVISRYARKITAAAIAAVMMCSLSGCAELGQQVKDHALQFRDLFLNSISRFPEGNNQDATLPQTDQAIPEFVLAPLGQTGLQGVISEDVNVRSGPGADYDHLGSLRTDTTVQIHHQMLLGDSCWGLTEAGWISMNFVILDDPTKAANQPLEHTNGLLIIPEVAVFSGPGWQYPVTGTLDGYTQVPLLAKSGAWYLIAQGWISLDDVYVEGTDPTYRAIITGSEVNIRTGPGTQYKATGVKNRNDVVNIFHQVSVDGKGWGYFGDGWISLSYAKLEKISSGQDSQNDQQPELPVGVQDSRILGTWQDVAIHEKNGTLTSLGVWHFNHDGTFLYISKDTHYNYNSTAGLTSGAAGVTEETELSGLYAFDGSTLVLFCKEVKGMADDQQPPYMRLIHTEMMNGEMVVVSGESSTRLYSGGLDDVAAKLLGNE